MRLLSTMIQLARARLAVGAAALVLAACGGGQGDAAAPTSGKQSAAPAMQALAVAVAGSNRASITGITVTGLTKLSETRVGRTTFDYVFRVSVANSGAAQTGVSAQITGAGPGTTVIDGSVQIGDLAAGGTASPSDTITLRQDRSLAFQPALLAWAFTAAGPVPASIALDVTQRVVNAGAPLALLPALQDAAGKAIDPAPAIGYSVTAAAGATGTLPTISGGQVNTSADTRGNYTVTGTVAGTSLTASATFTVLQSGGVSGNARLVAGLSASQGTLARQLTLAAAAARAGDATALAAASAAIASAGNAVELHRLGASTAFEPDAGFFPTAAKLAANGINATAADTGYANATNQLRSKLGQITTLLNNPTGNDAADAATLGALRQDLAAIAATLNSTGAQPTLYGLAAQADSVSDMLAKDMAALTRAMATRAQAQIASTSLLLSQPKQILAVRPAASVVIAPYSVIGGVLDAMGPIGELVNKIYGDYLNQIENAIILLAARDLLDAFLEQTVVINGVLSGAALLGPYAYNYPDSYIDLNGLTLAAAQGADVYMIGGAAIDALGGAARAITSLPTNPRNVHSLFSYFDGVMGAIDSVREAYDLAHQQPAYAIENNFSDNFGCLPSLSDYCIEMHYPAGFKNVSGGNVSFTVLMLIRTSGPRPQYGVKLFNFAPST